MQEAGPITFFRTIGIILLVIYGLKFIGKYIIPLLLKRAVNKAQERAQNQQNNYQETTESNVNVGETIIDKSSVNNSKKKINDDVGEYVDYEEVD
jgi:hypothetical protein